MNVSCQLHAPAALPLERVRFRGFGIEKNPLFPAGIRTADRRARHLVTIPTTLSRPLHVLKRQLHVTANIQHTKFVSRFILQYADYC
jgi:hypothetical protein